MKSLKGVDQVTGWWLAGARPGGVSAGGRLQLGDGQGGAGGLRGAAVLQRVLAVAAHDTPRHRACCPREQASGVLPTALLQWDRTHGKHWDRNRVKSLLLLQVVIVKYSLRAFFKFERSKGFVSRIWSVAYSVIMQNCNLVGNYDE